MGVRRSVLASALAIFVAGCAGSAPPAASPMPAPSRPAASPADIVAIPGTHAILQVPPGFTLARAFRGLEGNGAWIAVEEVQVPITEFRAAWSDDASLKERLGITVVRRSDLLSIDGHGFILEGTRDHDTATGTVTTAYIGSFQGDATTTIQVEGHVAQGRVTDLLPAVAASVRTAGFDPDLTPDPYAGLTFRVDPAPPLVLAASANEGVVLDTSGEAPPADLLEPTMAIEPARRAAMSLEDATMARLQGNQGWTVESIESQGPLRVGGVDGLETIALAVQEGQDIVLYVAILSRSPTDLEFLGRCRRDVRETCLAAFKATTRSFVPAT